MLLPWNKNFYDLRELVDSLDFKIKKNQKIYSKDGDFTEEEKNVLNKLESVKNYLEACEQYLKENPDVLAAGVDPWEHYNKYGKAEGRFWTSYELENMDIFVFSWARVTENAKKQFEIIKKINKNTYFLNCDPGNKLFGENIINLDNLFFGEQFQYVVDNAKSDIVGIVVGDAYSGDWLKILNRAHFYLNKDQDLGVYAPQQLWTRDGVIISAPVPHQTRLYPYKENGLFHVNCSDETVWFINKKLLEIIKNFGIKWSENKKGCGIDLFVNDLATNNGLSVVVDYNVNIKHPVSTGYDSVDSYKDMREFFDEYKNKVNYSYYTKTISKDKAPGFADDKKIILYQQFFKSTPEIESQNIFCLIKNINNKNIDKVVVLTEKDVIPPVSLQEKVVFKEIDKRLDYESWLNFSAEQYPDEIKVLANSDIYFDHTVKKLKEIKDWDNKLFIISRKDLSKNGQIVLSRETYQGESELIDPSFSQDAWVYRKKLKKFKADYLLGVWNCESAFRNNAVKSGVEVINLSNIINAIHVDWRPEKTRDQKAYVSENIVKITPISNEEFDKMNFEKFYSQFEEDKIIAEYFGEYKGVLLDIGANDGRTFSNSLYFLEKGWKGFLIEGSPFVFLDLKKLHKENNNIVCINKCLSEKEEIIKFYHNTKHLETEGRDLLSTVVLKNYDKWRSEGHEFDMIEVSAYRFEDIKKEFGINKIDYVSIDIEGKDLAILKQINLAELGTRLVVIEYNKDEQEKAEIIKYCKNFGLEKILLDNGVNIIIAK